MAITLQVVGLYYKYSLDIPFNQGPIITVKEVLDFAQENPQGQYSLSYSVGQGAGASYIDFIMTDIQGEFASPVSGTKYIGGQFSLKQSFAGIGRGDYTVCQYYIRDQKHLPISLPTGPETSFEQANVVQDGYTVIWRLVTICNAIPVLQTGPAASAAPTVQGAPRMNARLAKVVGKPAKKA
ncbi:hypothetical protein [uncultured Methylobacterium sp.]|uniref:hypothetical protein n=1 Tax=uncultured Methylobacterium sp. TaxID=157278 RepID=UPI0035C984D1